MAKKIFQKIQGHLMIFMLAFCIVACGYGITTALDSKKKNIPEQELKSNVQAKQRMEAEPETDTPLPAVPKAGIGVPKKGTDPVSVIGDSVFLGAAVSFKKIYKNAVIDAKISRQVVQGLETAKQMKKKGQLKDTVIIALGTNGTFNQETGQKLIDYLGKDRTIYWVNSYGKKLSWQGTVNKTIQKLGQKNKNVHIISWAKYAKEHPNWFYQDGVHLNNKGQVGFARFIKDAICNSEA